MMGGGSGHGLLLGHSLVGQGRVHVVMGLVVMQSSPSVLLVLQGLVFLRSQVLRLVVETVRLVREGMVLVSLLV